MTIRWSAIAIAQASAPGSARSKSTTAAEVWANTAKSSTSCSRRSLRCQAAATLRTAVSRYARTANSGPLPALSACRVRAKTSPARSSAVKLSRQQVRA